MNAVMKILIPIGIIASAAVLAIVMVNSRAPAERQAAPAPVPVVQVAEVSSTRYEIWVESRGVAQARTQGSLVAQVGGEVVKLNPNFRDGGFFRAGDVLVQIDARDYQAAVTIAKSELVSAQQRHAEEKALSEQAARDWARLGKGDPSDLTLRKPQLAAAEAAVAAAKARLAQARLDFSRTRVDLPYDGRVLKQTVDIGQVVTPGAVLGEVYATDMVEVRLPLSNRQLGLMQVPEQYRDGSQTAEGPAVELSAVVGSQKYTWQGQIVRSEGAIDSNSRQTFVVAQVTDPYAPNEAGRPPLKVGQYVEARIKGNVLENALVLPRSALRGENLVYVFGKGGKLEERELKIAWQGERDLVASSGVADGERVVVNLPPTAVNGMKVRLAGDDKP